MPGGQQQAALPIPGAEPAHDRAVVRRARPQPGARLGQDQLARHREHAHGVVQQVVHGARGHRPVRPAFFLGRAHDHLAIGPRHQVDVRAAHRGPDRVADDGRHPVRVAQPQQLALDRPDRGPHLFGQPGDRAGGASGGHDDLSRADLAAVREPDAAGPPVPGQHLGHAVPHHPHLGGRRRLTQRGRVPPVVDRPVAREQHAAVHVRGEEGLQLAAGPAVQFLRVQPGGPAERRQPHQRRVVAGVIGDGQRALAAQADPVAGHLLEFGRERTEPGHSEQVDAEQRTLAEQGLRDRGEHPGRHQRRGVAVGRVDQDGIEPGRGGLPGDRGPDDAAARDDDICGNGQGALPSPALPGSGTTVGGARPPSQPAAGLPWSELSPNIHPISAQEAAGRGSARDEALIGCHDDY